MAAALKNNDGWRECAMWLTRCNAIRSDHKANWPEASVADLAYTLRDGVVLCGLLNVIDPGCIDMKEVNQKPQMAQFLCLRNIKTFLAICKDIFKIDESELFDPSELFDLSNFQNVLHTLSVLSISPRAQRKGIAGFVGKFQSQTEDDMYRSLTSRDSHIEAELETEYSSYDEYSLANEEIYQEIFSQGRSADLPPWLNTAVSLEKRDYVIRELVETEKNYLDVLDSVQKHFMKPLKWPTYFREEEYMFIFGKIIELIDVHKEFYDLLCKAIKVGPNSGGRLGEVFLICREKFLVYGDYCSNLPQAQALLADLCQRNETLDMELQKCQEEANQGKFKLRDILFVPMQRILKYHLLLEKLLQETPQQHEDYRNLERAREAMDDVAQYINEVKRDSDTLQIIRDIQNSISDWNTHENMELKDYGRLLKDGELKIKAHDDSKSRLRYVFVFDQVMLMCKTTRGEQYLFRDSLHLGEYKIEDLVGRKTLQGSRWGFQWFLIHKSEKTAFTMYARTEDLKRKWIKALQEAMDNVDPPGSRNTDHRFSMFTFDKPQLCFYCAKYLKGRIFQGYKCEQCALAVHKQCIQYSGRCGGLHHRAPPELPPRPMPSPVEPQMSPLVSPRSSHTEELTDYLWYVGEVSRDEAQKLLQNEPDGTFLLRVRPQKPSSPRETIYALSLKTDSQVKHMKVCESSNENQVCQFFLSETRKFPSIEELVKCYEHTSLSENFVGLDMTLQLPYRRIPATVMYDFDPTESNQLPLRRGMTLYITSKEGDHKGWWKGRANGRVGFFPKEYVKEEQEEENLYSKEPGTRSLRA